MANDEVSIGGFGKAILALIFVAGLYGAYLLVEDFLAEHLVAPPEEPRETRQEGGVSATSVEE